MWRGGALLVETTMLFNSPHAILCIDYIWYVKASEFVNDA